MNQATLAFHGKQNTIEQSAHSGTPSLVLLRAASSLQGREKRNQGFSSDTSCNKEPLKANSQANSDLSFLSSGLKT
jgi:hypothetical protein